VDKLKIRKSHNQTTITVTEDDAEQRFEMRFQTENFKKNIVASTHAE